MTDLVKRLREWSMVAYEKMPGAYSEIRQAADRIEAQAAEIKTILDREADTHRRHDAKVDALEAEIVKLKDMLVWADLKIRSLPHTDQSDVEPIRAALGETK